MQTVCLCTLHACIYIYIYIHTTAIYYVCILSLLIHLFVYIFIPIHLSKSFATKRGILSRLTSGCVNFLRVFIILFLYVTYVPAPTYVWRNERVTLATLQSSQSRMASENHVQYVHQRNAVPSCTTIDGHRKVGRRKVGENWKAE